MSEGFKRTLQTAGEALATSALLRRAATDARGISDKIKLGALSDRYAEYAAALYDTAGEQPDAPADEQAALL